MKKLFTRTMLLLCALIAGSGTVWAEDSETITMNSKESVSGSNVTLAFANNGGNTSPAVNNNQTRLYPKNTITITSLGGKYLKQVDFTFKTNNGGSGNNKACPTGITVSTGTETFGTTTTSSTSGSWISANDNTQKVIITINGEKGNYTFSSAKVYYIESTDPSSEVAFSNEAPSITFPAQKTYSQEATTAEGYTGTVTYEITANTAGATIDGATVTVAQAGNVTVKATAPAITGFAKSEASYTLTVTDSRTSADLAYAEKNQTVTVGEVLDAPALINPHNLTVTYSSSNETISTVDANGNVTGVAVGSATITASFAGNDDYAAGSASYTITVEKAAFVITDGVFDFSENEDYGSGVSQSGVKEQTSTWKAGDVTMVMSGRNCWYTSGTEIRLYKASGGADAGNIKLAVPEGYAITTVKFTGASLNKMSADEDTYTVATDYKSAEWNGLANPVTFTASDRTDIAIITVKYAAIATITDAEYATFVSSKALDFSSTGITVYTATDEESKVTLNEIASGKVPANTPVVLYKEGADGVAISVPVIAEADAVGDNDLRVSTGTDVENMYVLAKNPTVGFYPWGGSGLSAGKVYLQGKDSYGARVFIGFGSSETTGIADSNREAMTSRGEYFNLAGQRVAQPTKGLYIVNGKKVILK